jgi:glutaredoxin
MRQVTVYSRLGCHLCEVAFETVQGVQGEANFELIEIFIDGQPDLIELYGEQVPVIQIDGMTHDYFKVDRVRFLAALRKS